MKLEFLFKRSWGNDRFYPINESAKTLCKFKNRLSMTKEEVLMFRDAGWEINIKLPEEKYQLD